MNGSTILSRDLSLLGMVETPTEEVALMQMVETVFLAGINLNTLFIIHIQHMTIFYNKIPCKALHCCSLEITDQGMFSAQSLFSVARAKFKLHKDDANKHCQRQT